MLKCDYNLGQLILNAVRFTKQICFHFLLNSSCQQSGLYVEDCSKP